MPIIPRTVLFACCDGIDTESETTRTCGDVIPKKEMAKAGWLENKGIVYCPRCRESFESGPKRATDRARAKIVKSAILHSNGKAAKRDRSM